MCVKKIHQFLSSIKKDAHKRKLVPFFLPHGVVSNSYSGCSAFFVTVRAGTAYWKIWRLVNNFFCSHNKVHCSEIPIVLINLLYHYFFHWIMANFNFVISQNAKWGLPVFTLIATGWRYQKIFFYKKALSGCIYQVWNLAPGGAVQRIHDIKGCRVYTITHKLLLAAVVYGRHWLQA